jgi:hypothetical protein
MRHPPPHPDARNLTASEVRDYGNTVAPIGGNVGPRVRQAIRTLLKNLLFSPRPFTAFPSAFAEGAV